MLKHSRACGPALALSLGVLCTPRSAGATGFSSARFGGEHGTPTSPNPTALYYNPAAITGADGVHLLADAVLLLRDTRYEHAKAPTDEPEPAGMEGANSDTAHLFNPTVLPMLGATFDVGDFAFGAAFYIPFGGGTMWDENDRFAGNVQYPGAVGGSQRWHALDGTMYMMYWTAGAAYEIPETGLSIGATVSLIRSEIEALNARTVPGNNDMTIEGRSLIDVGTWAAGFGIGAMYEAIDDTLWLGASYTSRPNVAGGHTLEGTLQNHFGSIDEYDVELHQDAPDIIRFGLRFKPSPSTELRMFGDWSRWSAFEGQCVALAGDPCEVDDEGQATAEPAPLQYLARNWHDAVALRVGGSIWPTPRWELFAGLGYDGNAVPDETLEPSLMDFEDFSTTLGARVALVDEHLHLELAYTHFYNIPRDNAGKSTLASAGESYYRAPDAGGRYAEVAGLINTTVEASF
ncbi:MAG: outer membrane protein transport protein [Deltaproteobacteria bacterium]|jgi:long-chain fatty acid transport protein|nr:outer membrane protein transport protein [Deltaproteobacteria bacterium]MBW2536024.1 outer membrane protein transport protein [Deltaproteobacteria bacterium]